MGFADALGQIVVSSIGSMVVPVRSHNPRIPTIVWGSVDTESNYTNSSTGLDLGRKRRRFSRGLSACEPVVRFVKQIGAFVNAFPKTRRRCESCIGPRSLWPTHRSRLWLHLQPNPSRKMKDIPLKRPSYCCSCHSNNPYAPPNTFLLLFPIQLPPPESRKFHLGGHPRRQLNEEVGTPNLAGPSCNGRDLIGRRWVVGVSDRVSSRENGGRPGESVAIVSSCCHSRR
ncbi:hypothetical protein JAAARDRAFT_30935 [Jaapia argillacea MUCL 33604]|uniref:Uncharacterized protein n=1 Tax=Jaapia argillacea MUCL 33604 TaxID=933084 RepID=A0A067QFW9_9AGAM|nr:hypothetical protein JAAARDRAFT_30935 [Jaapia argillacea MUCL 33604]